MDDYDNLLWLDTFKWLDNLLWLDSILWLDNLLQVDNFFTPSNKIQFGGLLAGFGAGFSFSSCCSTNLDWK